MALFFRQLTKRFSRPQRPPAQSAAARHRPGPASRPKLAAVPAYVVLVDESGSTSTPFHAASGRTVSRLEAIQRAARGYLDQLVASNHRQLVALAGFSTEAHLHHALAPVGRAMHSLSRALWSLHPQSATNLTAGLELALSELGRIRTSRGNIVLITDGAANMHTDRLPGLIRQARAARVRIFTIGVGNDGDADYDRSLLVHTACSTGGRFMSAHSFKALCGALRRAC